MISLNAGLFKPMTIIYSVLMLPLIGMGWAVLIIERRADAIAIIIGLSLLYLLIVFGLYKHSKNEQYYLTVKETDMDVCYPKGMSNNSIGNVAYRDVIRIEYYRVSSVRAWLKVFFDYVCPQCAYMTFVQNGETKYELIGHPLLKDLKRLSEEKGIELVIK